MRKNSIKVSFKDGQAASHVTGSCVHFESKNINFVIECGLSQSNNLERDYLENREKFSFSCKKVQYVFLGHAHLDHSGRLPLLYKYGCTAPLFVAEGNKELLINMLNDCVKIMEKDADFLTIKKGRTVNPIYTKEDVDKTLAAIVEIPFNKKVKLDDNVTFNFIHSGHIAHAAQIELWLTENYTTKKVLYTSDLGNPLLPKFYSEPIEYCQKANLVIGETTYGDPTRPAATKKTRESDLKKLEHVINATCIENKAKVLIPSFALDRLPELLTIINDLVPNHNIPIIVDTPLGVEHIKTYIKQSFNGPILQQIIDQSNVHLISDYLESKLYYNINGPAIILSSSGMMTAGRVLNYLPNILSNEKNFIVFCGYATEGSLAHTIKEGKKKIVYINDKKVRNNCNIMSLNSFTSHMQFNELLDYYSSMDYEKIALVHGQQETKNSFAALLQDELSKRNKTSKVISIVKGTEIHL